MTTTALARLTGTASLTEAELILADSPLNDVDAFDFVPSTLRVASSGARAFVDENDEMVKAPLKGIILGAVKTRALWLIDGEKVPFCSSIGGEFGRIRQGIANSMHLSQKELDAAIKSFARPHPAAISLVDGEVLASEYPCATCPMNDFNTSLKSDGRGKACSEKRRILFLSDEWAAPVILSIPTMSIKNFNNYCSGIQTRMKGARYYGVRTEIDVVKDENARREAYGRVTFKFIERITDPAQAAAIREIQQQLVNFLTTQPIVDEGYDMPPATETPVEGVPVDENGQEIPF